MNPEAIISDRAGRALKIPQGGYWAFIPSPLPPSLSYNTALARLLGEASVAIGELAGAGRMLPKPYMLIGPAMRREAVLSSRIEGTQSDLDDLYFFEAEPNEASSKPDVREVHNYVRALEYGLKRIENFPVCSRLFTELHEHLMQGVRGEHATPGEFRRSQNWIGSPGCLLNEAMYVPPPVDEMNAALSDLEKFLHADTDIPELVRLAIIHAQFEMIHPFIDGNGRIGRLLVSLLLVDWGLLPDAYLYLSAFFERYRDDYYRCLLRISHEGGWEDWVEFFLRGVREQSRAALSSARQLLDLQAGYRERLSGRRVSKITYDLLDQLFASPYVSVPLVRDKWKVNFRTAEKAISDMCGISALKEVTAQRRNRMWAAPEIMKIIRG